MLQILINNQCEFQKCHSFEPGFFVDMSMAKRKKTGLKIRTAKVDRDVQ